MSSLFTTWQICCTTASTMVAKRSSAAYNSDEDGYLVVMKRTRILRSMRNLARFGSSPPMPGIKNTREGNGEESCRKLSSFTDETRGSRLIASINAFGVVV